MFNILSHFSLFPQLTAVDDVLPNNIRRANNTLILFFHIQ